METMIDLHDLLKHEIMDLYSAEEQIIEALPAMIEKANNNDLKTALREHLKITEKQKARLDEIKQMMGGNGTNENVESTDKPDSKPGFFSRMFGGGQKCKGMEGLITEGNKMMGEDMTPEVLDSAIIAGAQKIEHYEICGYGTARAFARELNMGEVASKLTETLNEEYDADERLTQLAVGKLNIEAEQADGSDDSRSGSRKSSGGSSSKSSGVTSKGSGKTSSASSKSSPGSKSAAKSSAAKSSSKSPVNKSTSSGKGSSSKGSGKSKSSKSSKAGKTSSKSNVSKSGGAKSKGKSSSGRSKSSSSSKSKSSRKR